jgi:transposase-like protein
MLSSGAMEEVRSLHPTLSPAQAQVVIALAHGSSVNGAALAVGVHRSTIYNWLTTQPEFALAVDEARVAYACEIRDELRELSRIARDKLRALLDSRFTTDAIHTRIALAILHHSGFPRDGWNLPEPLSDWEPARKPPALAPAPGDSHRTPPAALPPAQPKAPAKK